MLILSRKLNESIIIDGRITVKILRIDRDTVKVGIQAPSDLPVHRQEIFEAIQRNKAQAPAASPSQNVGTDAIPKSPTAQVTPPSSAPPPSRNGGNEPGAK